MLLLLVLMITGFVQSRANAAGDPQAGGKLAKEVCARCHDITPTGAFKRYPPSFASIAVYRSQEQIFARIVSPPTHSGMPEVALYLLLPDQVADLVSYIMSLERKSP
jgi:mono/diheme cytochrome c family protein